MWMLVHQNREVRVCKCTIVASHCRWLILLAALLLAAPALAQPLSITTTSPLPSAIAGVAYSPLQFTATGGVPPYSWAITGGAPPSPMTFTGGTLAGTPATAGIYN